MSMLPIHTCIADNISDLENITIQVIGLDEIPDSSLEIIPLPEPDLGEISHINRDISRDSKTPTPAAADSVLTDNVTGGGAPAPPPSAGPAPQATTPQ